MNNQIVFIIISIGVVIIALCAYRRNGDYDKYTPVQRKQKYSDGHGGDIVLSGVPPETPAFEIGFGMGPGLYGSGRHTSEMVGN